PLQFLLGFIRFFEAVFKHISGLLKNIEDNAPSCVLTFQSSEKNPFVADCFHSAMLFKHLFC
ncbi:MAG TPA: hypothetical protein PK745_04500, partial [bacterium]|nr:hypothetical protein [bacterium]